jgi:hypothetical protein
MTAIVRSGRAEERASMKRFGRRNDKAARSRRIVGITASYVTDATPLIAAV